MSADPSVHRTRLALGRSLALRAAVLAVATLPGSCIRSREPAPAVTAESTAPELYWLAGCWQRTAGSLLIEEQWLYPRAGILLGLSRTTRGDTLVEYEFLRIQRQNDSLVLTAHPSRQQPAEFVARTVTTSEVVFENPAHDFPQRVRYRAVRADSLLGRIEGVVGGRERAVDFPYARVRCIEGRDLR